MVSESSQSAHRRSQFADSHLFSPHCFVLHAVVRSLYDADARFLRQAQRRDRDVSARKVLGDRAQSRQRNSLCDAFSGAYSSSLNTSRACFQRLRPRRWHSRVSADACSARRPRSCSTASSASRRQHALSGTLPVLIDSCLGFWCNAA